MNISLKELKRHSREIASAALEQAAIIADNNNGKDIAIKIREYKEEFDNELYNNPT